MLHHVKYLFAALTISCALNTAIAQDSQSARPVIIGKERAIDGANCEDTMAVLDLIAQDAKGEGTIIIISQLGLGESSRNLGCLRLRNLRKYLYMTRGVERESIVIAEGEGIRGLGKVDVYVGGKLHSVFYMKRRRVFWKGCWV